MIRWTKKLNTNYPLQVMKNFMKKEVKLEFKMTKSIPVNVKFDQIHSARNLFAVKIT